MVEPSGAAPPPVSYGRLAALDYLRFAAAVSVLCFHYLFNGIAGGKVDVIELSPVASVAKYGYLGVDLFFLISGFVIATSARGKTARQYLVGRAVRLYPAFWAGVLVTTAVTLLIGGAAFSVTPVQVVANLTMVQQLLGQPSVDGVYWTLFLELQFYALVLTLLLLRLGRFLSEFCTLWAFGMLAVSLLVPSLGDVPFLGGYFSLFATGAVIAALRERGPRSWLLAGLAAGLVTTLRFEVKGIAALEASKSTDYSAVVLVVLLIAFHVALLSFCWPRVADVRLPGSRRAGALTYPLYVVHAHVGYMLIQTFANESNKWWVYLGVVAVVLGLAWCVHELVERRLQSAWFWLFDRTVGVLIGAVSFRRRAAGAPQSAGAPAPESRTSQSK